MQTRGSIKTFTNFVIRLLTLTSIGCCFFTLKTLKTPKTLKSAFGF
ncbi:hypothetical protein AEST_23200 [Alishewanella aestuarii B11]|uniref:Uncharacterized protein n=1 Tax=Alishewanella aestuarii B11 TaxID=1197174 RepID=J1Q2A9_9ALTE|nr:hypothetical protein AEST_23200 [Alishewanella aestuarii B11]